MNKKNISLILTVLNRIVISVISSTIIFTILVLSLIGKETDTLVTIVLLKYLIFSIVLIPVFVTLMWKNNCCSISLNSSKKETNE